MNDQVTTGQLYLGVFSGPVEGILMIVGLYIVTGFYGKHCTYESMGDTDDG